MQCAIYWLRRDLRLHDNPALQAALQSAATVVPVYIHAPGEEQEWAPGAAADWWLHHSLTALDADLRARGSGLLIRRGPALTCLRALVEETGAAGVFWNRLYEPALVARDREIKTTLREQGLTVHSSKAAVLFEPWEVRTGKGDPYRVFTPFWRNLSARGEPAAVLPAPERIPAPRNWPAGESAAALELLPTIDWTRGMAAAWQPGEAGALAQLERFVDQGLADYDEARDYPARDGVSRLSPFLHHGEISPRQVWHAASARPGAPAFLRELGWREFAHHVLFHFPHTPTAPLNQRYADFPWRRDYHALLQAWQNARTGFPIVDAGLRELWHTGWMHNRVRMIAGSLLVKNIRAPWVAGARWFWDTLVDADLASNTLGWQWVAGCGADAAPYFRIFNPVRQGERFDAAGAYVRHWVPELARVPDKRIHCPWRLSAAEQKHCGVILGRDYPQPVVDLARSREEALEALAAMR